MGILGILTCEILELEFAELLAADKEVGRITVLENDRLRQNGLPLMRPWQTAVDEYVRGFQGTSGIGRKD